VGKLKFIDMFCGIGTIRMGMEQAGHECVYSIEWDKHKRRIYSVIFGKEPEGRDIRECRGVELPRADCWCFGAPCQDFSLAGERKGLEGDRSSLVQEVFRLIRETPEEYRPKYLLYENVKGMLSSNKGFDFFKILFEMASLSYDTIRYSILNSKDFGVPQNRERVFTIGFKKGESNEFEFPVKQKLSIRLKDILESEVDRKYYVSEEYHRRLIVNQTNSIIKQPPHGDEIKIVGTTVNPEAKGTNFRHWVHDTDGIIGALTACDYKQPRQILVRENTKKGYAEAYEGDGIRLDHIGGSTGRARVQPQRSNTLTTGSHAGVIEKGFKIRRLTPKECWRLQGVPDTITDKVISSGIIDTHMYRGAGDACTVNVIYEIAKRLS
jgi:DNA (cytosine-5)-methyltransferase 1